jgi:hypothetical protein
MLKALDVNSDVSAGVLAALGKLSGEARSRLDPALNVRAFLDTLRRDGLLVDAVGVLTHCLPRQYALAWACECWQDAHAGIEPDPADKSALAAAQRWLKEPTEDNRRAAFELADRLEYRTAATWLAAGAGWAGGSLLPPGQTEIPPPPTLSGEAVSAAVILTAAEVPAAFQERIGVFVDRALASFAPASG